MSEKKAKLISAQRQILPDDMMSIIAGCVVPGLPAVTPGTDAETAAIALSQYAANANTFLQCFSGINLLEFLLCGCSYSPIFQTMLLTMIKHKQGGFLIVAPAQGGEYTGFFTDWEVSISRGNEVSVEIDCEGDQVEMTAGADGRYTAEFPIPMGKHTAAVNVTYGDGSTQSKTVSFEVTDFDVSPPSGSEVTQDQEFYLYAPESLTVGATIKVGSETQEAAVTYDPVVGAFKTAGNAVTAAGITLYILWDILAYGDTGHSKEVLYSIRQE